MMCAPVTIRILNAADAPLLNRQWLVLSEYRVPQKMSFIPTWSWRALKVELIRPNEVLLGFWRL